MELNQLSDSPNEDEVIELLTLTCEVSSDGTKIYRNKDGDLHRIYGPAVVFYFGEEQWWKDGKLHREDGPAVLYNRSRYKEYWINGIELAKDQFIQWQRDNGIKPSE